LEDLFKNKLDSEDDIKKSVVRVLDYYQSVGVVLNWERINCGKVQHFGNWFYGAKAGFPDIFAEVIKDNLIYICYFELKKPVGGKWSDEQIIFKAKREGFINVSYDLVNDPKIVSDRIEGITNFIDNSLKEADKLMDGE
jgi:hypothetical protein